MGWENPRLDVDDWRFVFAGGGVGTGFEKRGGLER